LWTSERPVKGLKAEYSLRSKPAAGAMANKLSVGRLGAAQEVAASSSARVTIAVAITSASAAIREKLDGPRVWKLIPALCKKSKFGQRETAHRTVPCAVRVVTMRQLA